MQRCIAIFLVCSVVLSIFGVQREILHPEPLNTNRLEPGDILFVDLYEGWCIGGFWDHIALYVGVQDCGFLYGGVPSVLEATFDAGVCLTPVASFLERDHPAKVDVRRIRGITDREEVIKQAVAYALTFTGKPFDYTATITFPAKINEGNYHCVEVVWRAYTAAGVDLDGNGGWFLYPDDIYFNSKLTAL